MKTQFGKLQLIEKVITGVGSHVPANRKNNLQAILDNRSQFNAKLEGQVLRVNITQGLSLDSEQYAKFMDICAGHECNIEEKSIGTGYTYVLINLLRPK